MADAGSTPVPWTPLYTAVHRNGTATALCSDYGPLLVRLLHEMQLARRLPAANQPTGLDVGFVHNTQDVHTLVKMWNTATQDWLMLDPTFALTMKRASDGEWATPSDMHNATVSKSWNSIQYVFVGPSGDALAKRYYIDYPLLFLSDLPAGGVWPDPRPYMTPVSPPPGPLKAIYAIESNTNPVTVTVDGQRLTLDITDGVSRIFFARSIAVPPGSAAQIQVYKLNRYVFPFAP
jgi:hypothetical protein